MNNWIILIVLAFVLIGIRVRVKKRKFFWKDKRGNELSFKEFFGRWKSGVAGINPLQQIKIQLMGIWITLTGIISGIVVNALIRMENIWWWVEIILVGSLIITGVQMLGTYQKYLSLKAVQKVMDDLNKENKK